MPRIHTNTASTMKNALIAIFLSLSCALAAQVGTKNARPLPAIATAEQCGIL